MTNLKIEAIEYKNLTANLDGLLTQNDMLSAEAESIMKTLGGVQAKQASMTQNALVNIFMASLNFPAWEDFYTAETKALFAGKSKKAEAGVYYAFHKQKSRAKAIATAIEEGLTIQMGDDENFLVSSILEVSLETLTLSTIADKCAAVLSEKKKKLEEEKKQAEAALEVFHAEINIEGNETLQKFDERTQKALRACEDAKEIAKTFKALPDYVEEFIQIGRELIAAKLASDSEMTLEKALAESVATPDHLLNEIINHINSGIFNAVQLAELSQAIEDHSAQGMQKTA